MNSLLFTSYRGGLLRPGAWLLVLGLAARPALAQFTPVPLTASSFNVDVVADGNGSATNQTTSTFDLSSSDNVLMVLGYNNGNATATSGLPGSGVLNSAATPGLAFQLAKYNSNNSLRMQSAGTYTPLTLVSPVTAGTVYLLAAAGDGSGTMNVTVTFADNTTQVFSNVVVPDWYNGTPYTVSGLGRVGRSSNALQYPGNNPRLYEFALPLASANTTKPIVSLTCSKTSSSSGGVINVMGVSVRSALLLNGLAPGRNALAAAQATNLGLTFNQALSAASASNVRVFSSQRGGQLVRGGNATASGSTLTINPATDLLPGETAFVTLPATITSAAGEPAQPQVYQFTAAAGVGPAKFAGTTDVAVGTNPYKVVLGDVDNDGDLDLLTANVNANTVSVSLNNGNGTYGSATSLPVGTSPNNLTLGDVDGDGDLDLATSNSGSNSASLLLNNGSGIFGTATSLAVGSRPYAVVLGDVDGDGDLDMVAANSGNVTASILLNNGSGTFGTATNVALSNSPSALVLGDVDGDGDLDMVLTSGSNGVAIMLNNGSGTFSTGSSVAVSGFSIYAALGDVDADGDLDIVTANTNSGTASLLLNNGTGTFGLVTTINVGTNPSTVALGDIDGDGDLDMVTANNGGAGSAGIFLNNGTGTFGPVTTVPLNHPTAVVLGDVDGDGDLDLASANQNASVASVRLNKVAPVLTGISPGSGTVGAVLALTGTYFAGATAVSFNGTAATAFTVNSATSISVTVPAGATTGQVTVTTPDGPSNGLLFTVTAADLLVSTTQTIATGIYNTITVTSGGNATLGGNVQVNGALLVQNGGTLNTNCQAITGAGSFTLASGGTLLICDAAGIVPTGSTGAVQVAGTRSFATDASYVYNGTAAQATGTGLPALVRSFSTTNASDVTLTAPLQVAQTLTVGAAGNLILGGNGLTLLSSASGTALVVNSGTGQVVGAATVQRYLDPSQNPGLGYRHYSAPVSNTTVADLATSGFAPEISQAGVYNASAAPGTTTPFPTVFGYDQSRLTSAQSNYAPFDKGFVVPAGLSQPLQVGQGYAVNIGAAELVDFVGSLTSGTQTLTLQRNAAATPDATEAGWQLVGNPYPAPLDFSLLAPADRLNLDASFYVVESNGQYTGTYCSYVNGVGASPLIGSSQGFFVRVSDGQTSGTLTFRNSQRLTTYATQAPVRRLTADPRPLVQLSLTGVGGIDDLYAYAETGATSAFDHTYDAAKLANSTGLNLSSLAASGERLAIDGRPAFTAATVLPLAVGVPAAGTYTLKASALSNLPSGLTAYLTDAQTGQTIDLSQQASYSFSVTASQATALLSGRFTLRFGAATALATTPALTAAEVALFPNPAHASFTVRVPAVAGAAQVQATLRNTLGQQVRRVQAALPATGASFTIDTQELAAGVYVLQLQAGTTTLVKRVVIE